jgi:uncharacterized protein (DUF2062 family)
MWRYSQDRVRRLIQTVLHTHDSPERTAAAFAIGVTIGFSPFVGLHTAMAIAVAFFFNLNRVAMLAGAWLNLPWILGPYYAAATAFGSWLLQSPVPPHIMKRLQTAFTIPGWDARIAALGGLVEPLLWPFTLGSTIGAGVLGMVAYRLMLPLLLARRRHLLEMERGDRPDQIGKSL